MREDPAGWIRCCTRRFLPVARRVAGEDALARDALQEAWIIVLQRLNQYRGGSPACSWVRAIVRHEAIHRIAAQTRETPLSGAEQAADQPEIRVYEAELRVLLLAAIDELPPTYREAYGCATSRSARPPTSPSSSTSRSGTPQSACTGRTVC